MQSCSFVYLALYSKSSFLESSTEPPLINQLFKKESKKDDTRGFIARPGHRPFLGPHTFQWPQLSHMAVLTVREAGRYRGIRD